MRQYLEVWRLPSAPLLILAGIVGRLPVGIVPLALLLLVQDRTGSYGAGGATVAAYSVATAVTAPFLGRLADRRGPRPVLLLTGVAYPTLLIALAAVLTAGLPVWVAYPTAAAAGAVFPLLSSSLRALWNDLARDDAVRQTAYALESIAMEVVWIAGPILVAVVVAVASPVVALVGSALAALVGTLVVAGSAPARQRGIALTPADGAPRAARAPGGGPLRVPGLALLLVAVAALMIGFGALQVAVPAFAGASGEKALAGVLLGVWGVGSVVGGLWFGARRIALPLIVQYRWALLGVAAGMVPLAFVGAPWLLGAVLLAGGTAIAPAMAVQSGLVADLAPAGATTEAFTWVTTVVFAAGALGSAAAGLLIDRTGGVGAAFGLGAVSAFVAWAVVSWPGTRLTRRAGVRPRPRTA